jgi:hypothetical protein
MAFCQVAIVLCHLDEVFVQVHPVGVHRVLMPVKVGSTLVQVHTSGIFAPIRGLILK